MKEAPRGIDGAIVIDKPVGPTSFGVMRQVERRLGAARAGHAGTLDPMASGVLLVLLGEGTKLSSLLMEHDKVYEATIALGQETDTLDALGRETARAPVPALDPARIEAVLATFVGSHDQVPPVYSAIKKDGRSLMSRARAGESDIPAEPRRVVCHAARVMASDPLRVELHVGKGYYVRALARDLARALGTVGHLAALRRTRLGAFDITRAVSPDVATSADVIPMASMVPGLPSVTLSPTDVAHVRAGRPVDLGSAPDDLMALDGDGGAVAWIRRDPTASPGVYRVQRGFVPRGPQQENR